MRPVHNLGTDIGATGAMGVWLWPAAVTATRCVRAPDPLGTCKSRSWTMSCASSAEDHKLSLQLPSLAKHQFLSEALRYNPCGPSKVSSTFVPESQSLWWMIYVRLLSCCNALRDVKFWIHLCEMRDQPRTVLTIRKMSCILSLSESLLSTRIFFFILNRKLYIITVSFESSVCLFPSLCCISFDICELLPLKVTRKNSNF